MINNGHHQVTALVPSRPTKPASRTYPYIGTALTPDAQITAIENSFRDIMVALGLDIHDDSLTRTPHRFAKMLVNEVFDGLDRRRFPEITTQDNKFRVLRATLRGQHLDNQHLRTPFRAHHRPVPYRIHPGRSADRTVKTQPDRPPPRAPTPSSRTVDDPDRRDPRRAGRNRRRRGHRRRRASVRQNAWHRGCECRHPDHGTQGAFQQSDVRKEYFAAIPRLSDLKSI